MAKRVFGIGETVLDIIFKHDEPQAAKPGGSALNSLVSLGRIGVDTTFISELGNDLVGGLILRFLKNNNISTDYINQFSDGKSPLSIAFLNEQNDAEYNFYKFYPSQRLKGDVPDFTGEDIVLFGSFFGLNQAIRGKVLELLTKAQNAGAFIYYDPNFRSSHLHELPELMDTITENMSLANLVRGSDEDFLNIFGTKNAEDTYEEVKNYCPYLIYTANVNGVTFISPEYRFHVPVENINPVSTIGAGDNFNAGFIYGLVRHQINPFNMRNVDIERWRTMVNIAIEFSTDVCMHLDNYITYEMAAKYRF